MLNQDSKLQIHFSRLWTAHSFCMLFFNGNMAIQFNVYVAFMVCSICILYSYH